MKYFHIFGSLFTAFFFLALMTIRGADGVPVISPREEQLQQIEDMLQYTNKRMGWRKCNSWFKWRCGKTKVIHKKLGNADFQDMIQRWN